MLRFLGRNRNVLAGILVTLLAISMSFAQNGSNVLVAGEPSQGTIDENNPAQVFVYSASAGETIDLRLTSASPLTMILTDASGNLLGQVTGEPGAAELSIPSVTVESAGNYFVTVFPANGSNVTLPAEFFITVRSSGGGGGTTTTIPDSAPSDFNPGQQVSLPLGVQVNLRWNTIDDLNLQIRDPVGGTLFWDTRTTTNGGTFGPDRNGLCEIIVDPPSDQTVETAEWPGGGIFVGSYEVLVYYRTYCGGSDAVDFTVDVTVNGNALETINGTLLAPATEGDATVYLSSFTIDTEGNGSVNRSGPYIDTRELPISTDEVLNSTSTPIALDETLNGTITNDNYFSTFTFEGLANQLLNISLTATNGSLDPLLLVLNSTGNVIAANDDIVPAENVNSAITPLILPADDVYTIMATRYGKDVGGTEGAFTLSVTGSDIPQELLDRDLPTGNIQVFLQWDTNADLQLLVRDPFGDTVFNDEPAIRSGGRLVETGNINCTVSEDGTPPLYYSYWPENTFLNPGAYEVEVQYRSECGDTRPVTASVNVVVDGQLIYTDNFSIAFNERYLTSFSIDGPTGTVSPSDGGILGGSETLPWQPALPSATVLAGDETRTGSITPADKFDLYVFDGQAGDTVTISMTRTSGNLDTLLFLADPNNIELASNDDVNDSTDSLISVTLQEDGRYTIIATHFGGQYGGTVGGYNLALQIDR